MIFLKDVLSAIEQNQISEGWLVGGVVEKGWSARDADLIVKAKEGVSNLPDYFHITVQEAAPSGPNIPLSELNKMKAFGFKFMKPQKTENRSNEYYDIDEFKDFKGGAYFVEPKYDGIRVQLRKTGYLIQILTDEGNEIAEKLPNIAEQARKIPYTSCILDAELVMYRGSQRLDHTAVTAYLHSTTPPEDYHHRLKPFDIVYAEGEDLRTKSLAERKKALAKVQWTEHIHPVKYKLVKAEDLIPAIKEMATSEGAMIKDADSTYNAGGEGWWKWKRQFTLDVLVVKVDKKDDGYVYTCKVGDVEIGDTYVTKIEAKEGDVITVSVDHVTKKQDGSWGWYAPKAVSVRKDKKESDPVSVLEKFLELKGKAKGTAESASTEQTEGKEDKDKQAKDKAPVLEGRFVLQEHWWGDKHHFDLRFSKKNSAGQETMIGWTLLADRETELFDKLYKHEKILALRKQYHDPKWLDFEGDIQPGNPGNPTVNYTAHMRIRDNGAYKFNRRDLDFVEMELSGTRSEALKGIFFVRKVELQEAQKDAEADEKADAETGDTDEKWLFWKAKEIKRDVNQRVSFQAQFRVIESPQAQQSSDYVDIEVNVISTNITLNRSQYTIEDLEANSKELNEQGGLIFAMGKHPNMNEEPDASDNVGIGMTAVGDGILKSKARIYNTSTYPDMVQRIRRRLIRDVSIEAFVSSFKKVCNSETCWKRYIGTKIYRAVFVSIGSDPSAKITRVLESIESIESTVQENTMTEQTEKSTTKEAAATATEAADNAQKEIEKSPTPPPQEQKAQTAAEKPPETKPLPGMEEQMKMLGSMQNMMETGFAAIKSAIEALAAKVGMAPEPAPGAAAQKAGEAAKETEIPVKPAAVAESRRVVDSPATPGMTSIKFTEEVRELVR